VSWKPSTEFDRVMEFNAHAGRYPTMIGLLLLLTAFTWMGALRFLVRPKPPDAPTDQDRKRNDNLDVILTYIKERTAAQTAQIAALDGKANFGLAAASLLTTGIASLHNVDPGKQSALPLLPHLAPSILLPAAGVVTGVAFATYIVVVYSAFQAYKVRGYMTVPDARVLLSEYWWKSSFETKADLASTMAAAIEKNEPEVTVKARWVRIVTTSLLVEAVLLLLLLGLQLSV
jgi:hypothetical protein